MSTFIAIILYKIIMVEELKVSSSNERLYLLITHMGAGKRPKKQQKTVNVEQMLTSNVKKFRKSIKTADPLECQLSLMKNIEDS